MQNLSINEKVSKVCSNNGIEVYKIDTKKFKTNSINIFFLDNLRRETASMNAMVPAVLRRGCGKFQTYKDIALYLEELYGASFDCGVTKKGEQQIIQFYMEFVADKYTGENTNLFEKAVNLLYEIIMNPVVENGAFKEEYIRQEKENLKRLIESRINDKVQYAVEKCFEVMCKDEPFGIYDYGSLEDVNAISNKELYEHYNNMLRILPVKIYICGDMEEEIIKEVLSKFLSIDRENLKQIEKTDVFRETADVKDVTENMDVNQAKLSLGFRTNTSPGSDDYYKLIVYNGILGGGIHSKLFQNVREKASLAYYVFSRLEKFKGLMVISSGIEAEKREQAEDIILKQMREIREGNITDYEFDSTIKAIETGLRSLNDSQIQMVDFYLSQAIVDSKDSLESVIMKVKEVTKQDVIDIASKIKLDTKYFLKR
ncbi:MAG: EF-P 5-aminopentanol modification-associated protein YfmF [Acetivibrionales bacterium]|jgi:predicted Zn-dependent peptidase